MEKRPLIIIVFLPCLMRGPSGVLLTDNLCRGTYQETAIVAVAPPDRNTTDGAFHVVDVPGDERRVPGRTVADAWHV